MPSAAALRFEIENALATRIPGALTPRERVVRDLASTGVPELDALLEGGFPVGAISELVGPSSSGRTTLALAALAAMTGAEKTVAWVDAADALDPESAAAAGASLDRLLWVRCGQEPPAPGKVPAPAAQPGGRAALLVEGSRTPAPSGGCGSPHPRGEARGLSEAVNSFLRADPFSRPAPPRDPAVPRRNRMIGTPSAPNRKLLDRTPQDARSLPRRARDREEQIPTDRQPSRRQQREFQMRPNKEKSLGATQIAYTLAQAANRPQAGGAWTDNANNAHGRSLQTAPNAIAAGLPRFQAMEAQAAGQGHGTETKTFRWKPDAQDLLPDANKDAAGPSPERRSDPGATGKAKPSLAGEAPDRDTLSPVWQALDQALRAADLLLAAGGFGMLVLDLGSIPASYAWRIPLATWFRFRAAADRSRAVLLLLTQHPCARSSAELVLRLCPSESQDAGTVLTGARFRISVDRLRFEGSFPEPEPAQPVAALAAANTLHLVPPPRKQPRAERAVHWSRAASWTGTNSRAFPPGGRT